jgi:DNA-binding FadR family transcriptional regulator
MDEPIRLDRRSIHHQISEHLRELIVSGELKPGEALPSERELAARFSVSRNSLRQAIAFLEAMGLVETRHGAGVFVAETSSEATVSRFADVLLDPRRSLVDVVEGRLAIEPTIAEIAAERRSEVDVAEIQRYGAPEADADPSISPGQFHPRIVMATHNPVLIGIQRALTTGPGNVAVLLSMDPAARVEWERAHHEIYVAVRDSDPAAAALLMKEHLEHVLALAKQYSSEVPEPPVT